MSNIKRNIIYFVIGIAVIGLYIGALNILKPKVPKVDHWEPYIVQYGDTLWNIVPAKSGYDIRDIIDLVEEHNDIDALIVVNDVIEIPVWGD